VKGTQCPIYFEPVKIGWGQNNLISVGAVARAFPVRPRLCASLRAYHVIPHKAALPAANQNGGSPILMLVRRMFAVRALALKFQARIYGTFRRTPIYLT